MIHHEFEMQCALMENVGYRRCKCPDLDLIYAIPNGEARTGFAGARLKLMGTRAGMPDLCLPVARKGYHALFIEMKYGKGKPSLVQLERIDKLVNAGNLVMICYSVDEAWNCICSYMGIEP
jgi:hypothetical protein